MLEFRNVAGPGIRVWVQLRAARKMCFFRDSRVASERLLLVLYLLLSCSRARSGYSGFALALRASLWLLSPLRSGSLLLLPRMACMQALQEQKPVAKKSLFLEVPLMPRPVIAPLKNFLYHGGEIIRSAC